MDSYYVDMHIHIGRTEKGSPVKISGAKNLTFYNIAKESSERKGIDIVGIIDCHSPTVQEEIIDYLDKGEMVEQKGGGIRYHQTTVLLGSEIEVRDPGMGMAHLLVYLPTLSDMQDFTSWMRRHMKNVELSSQRIYVTARNLQEEVIGRGGMMIPAHIFTPYKSIYGSCTAHISDMLDLQGIAAIELGLSADTAMVGGISELDRYAFISNSDAHSLAKIGREYNKMKLAEANYAEVVKALAGVDGRCIEANYGLNPRLGKYHRSFCANCQSMLEQPHLSKERCVHCGSTKIVQGVFDRIQEISDRDAAVCSISRPPYQFQVPLEFLPGLGPKKLNSLLEKFGTEMNILHRVTENQLSSEVGAEIANYIALAREGLLDLHAGGGGHYGKVKG